MIIINKDNFVDVLSTCSEVAQKSPLQITEQTRLDFHKGHVDIAATDLTMLYRETISVENGEQKTILVDSRRLKDFVKNIPGESVFLDFEDNTLVLLSGGSAKYRIRYFNKLDDWPDEEKHENFNDMGSVQFNELKDIIDRCSWSMFVKDGTKERRGHVLSCLFNVDKNKLTFSSLYDSGSFLAYTEKDTELLDFNVKIRKDHVLWLGKRKLQDFDLQVFVTNKDVNQKIKFVSDDIEITFSTMECDFPLVEKVIEGVGGDTYTFNRDEIHGLISRATALKSSLVDICISDDGFFVSSFNDTDEYEEKTAGFDRDNINVYVCMNPDVLKKIISAISCTEFNMFFNRENVNESAKMMETPYNSGVFMFKDEDFKFLAMPIMPNHRAV